MLASTVQFSNNDQPPITPPSRASSLGPAPRDDPAAVPSDTQQRARPDPVRRSCFPRSCEQYLQPPTREPGRIINVPPMSNQHQTFADVLASDRANSVRSAP